MSQRIVERSSPTSRHDNPTSQCGEAGEQEQIYVIREDSRTPARADPAERVRAFYDRHPYPAPVTNLDRYIELYRNPDRHRALALLFWPTERPRADREILVAGCGTSQAARHALREPGARVTAIDISETSLHHTGDLQRKLDATGSYGVSAAGEPGELIFTVCSWNVMPNSRGRPLRQPFY
jgi:SAM-dependent methyltransferase